MSQMAISIMSPSDPVDGSEGLIMEVAVGDMLKVCTETTTMSLTFAQVGIPYGIHAHARVFFFTSVASASL